MRVLREVIGKLVVSCERLTAHLASKDDAWFGGLRAVVVSLATITDKYLTVQKSELCLLETPGLGDGLVGDGPEIARDVLNHGPMYQKVATDMERVFDIVRTIVEAETRVDIRNNLRACCFAI